ncbi:cobalamin B12-binding domain-containing protein [Peloplasma aerotolerans]|uniref:Cobalamin B12-binding domain-containing protein n=1 Tax=Peloplasma aerotolerans TaxID=3044389 RepID=A0AAW6U9J4_9MOLU|nr:cobalamin B12-binding domain-containing protein [Mariniplasma sp. M4Ah]MDI6452319.1 cobalamin B12-binding domain-containing protein [Mariniplasma sp. M4Ah]
MKQQLYDEFYKYLEQEQKDQAVRYAIGLLDSKTVTIDELYQDFLTPSLIHFECKTDDLEVCIWKEHFRTSIIRTILESSYMYIIEQTERTKKYGKKIVVLTPTFEYHEIGAIINTHYFLLEGFDASYIGANTPKNEILSAIRAYHPDYIALSVTNSYNLVITKQITEEIKRFFPEIKIILGGQAFSNEETNRSLTYDYILHSYEDIKLFGKEVKS